MKQYNIRVYYAHDCSSWDGFNNGRYLDDEYAIFAGDEIDAVSKAMAMHREIYRSTPSCTNPALDYLDAEGTMIAWVVAWIRDGEELTEEEYYETEDKENIEYLYAYLNFEAEEQL